MNKGKVLIAAPVHPVLTDGLLLLGYELLVRENITQQEGEQIIGDCVGVITSTRLQLHAEILAKAPGLQWIGRMGSGMEVIDLAFAQEKGIHCFGSPEGNCNAVAEHALGMLLALNKKIILSNNEVKEGKWIRDANRGTELEGKTIGIIGFGHTGRAFAKKLSGFDMNILSYDKYDHTDVPSYVMACSDLERLYEEADIISFHVPLQEDTFHYFNNHFAGKMRKPFILLNTSRGAVVDIQVLYNGLLQGNISGACLDVLEEEPLEKMSMPLRETVSNMSKLANVIITPHIAGYSHEALFKMSNALLSKIVTLK